MSEPQRTGNGGEAYEGFPGRVERSVRDSVPWWPERGVPGAPNIVLVLTDDMGFSDTGPYGSEIATPVLDDLAGRSVLLTNYHTAPMCSPARAALLTGLNPHRAGYGAVTNLDPGFPGYTMEFDKSVPTLAEVLRCAGYATLAVGKWHLTRIGAQHPAGERDSWPIQRGFDQYYGVLEGFTNFFHPGQLVTDNSPLNVDEYADNYYLTDDYTDRAIGMIKDLRAHDARRPFFLYFAHNAVHAPLQAPAAFIERHIRRYDAGWDRLREERFRRQLELGLFPEGTRLPERNAEPGLEVDPWQDTDPSQRALLALYMSVYAAMVENVDWNLGRLLTLIDELGETDNTVVVFSADNGASPEGGAGGTRSYFSKFVGSVPLPSHWEHDVVRPLEVIGGPRSLVHYPRAWAMVSNTPFRLYKGQTYAGGVRVPFLISWPGGGIGTRSNPQVRSQYVYVTDVMPTLLDLIGVDRPAERHGHPAPQLDGVSAVPVLKSSQAGSAHRSQYIELMGNRSMYADGWKLISLVPPPAPVNDRWHLYNIEEDPTEVVDVGSEFPEIAERLRNLWEEAAWSNRVYPQDDGSLAMRFRRRPTEGEWNMPLTVLPGTSTMERYRSAALIQFRSFDIVAKYSMRDGAMGVLVSHGDQGGGYILYVDENQIHLGYNAYGSVSSCSAAIDGAELQESTARFRAVADVAWEVELLGSGGSASLGPVPMLIGQAPFQGISVGRAPRSPVVWEIYQKYGAFHYTGQIESIRYVPGEAAPYDPRLPFEVRRAADISHE